MPQSSDEMRKLIHWIVQCKPDNVVPSDGEVCDFLIERGYQLQADWTWVLPSEDHSITEMELLCLRYLVEEWDYGGIQSAA